MKTLKTASIVTLVLSTLCLANSAPTVTSVTAQQRTDGSGIVDIWYTLGDADNDRCDISISVSDDGGSTWNVSASSFSGDIGSNISPGRRHIIWYTKSDLPGEYGTNYRVKVIADDGASPGGMVWVYINDPGVSGHEGFTGYMSKYETTNAQYCQFLNSAFASGDITVTDNIVYGANGANGGVDYAGNSYYDLWQTGWSTDGAINGGASRINFNGSSFTVDSGYENHPVTGTSWYGSMAFCNYYGYRLPTQWEWQAVADYDGSYIYGCGTTISNEIANYRGSIHPDGTTVVGSFGYYGYGIADLAGNVHEWVSNGQVLGGGWARSSSYCEVNHEGLTGYLNGAGNNSFGFRVCR
jgi:hypothetical protein